MTNQPPPLPQMPTTPPPYQPPSGGGSSVAAQKVQGPGIGLMVVGGLGILGSLLGLVMNLAGLGMAGLSADQMGAAANFLGGGVGILFAILGFGIYGFVLWGGLQMRALSNKTLVLIASIVAMLPCSLCCLIGLPVGIWSIVTLNDPAVSASFKS